MTTVDWEIEQYNLCAVQRFADDPEFRTRVVLAADMARRVVELMGLRSCARNHTLDYRRAAAIAMFLTEEAS